MTWVCAYDGTKKKLKDGRCAACGRGSQAEAKRDALAWCKHEPYLWLQDEETTAQADCGCFIDGQAFYQCSVHSSAKELLSTLKELVKELRDTHPHLTGKAHDLNGVAWKLIAKAEGR